MRMLCITIIFLMYFWYYHHEAYSKVYGTVGMECTTKLYGIVGQMHRVPRFTFQKHMIVRYRRTWFLCLRWRTFGGWGSRQCSTPDRNNYFYNANNHVLCIPTRPQASLIKLSPSSFSCTFLGSFPPASKCENTTTMQSSSIQSTTLLTAL